MLNMAVCNGLLSQAVVDELIKTNKIEDVETVEDSEEHTLYIDLDLPIEQLTDVFPTYSDHKLKILDVTFDANPNDCDESITSLTLEL
jgi:hypothetical protein